MRRFDFHPLFSVFSNKNAASGNCGSVVLRSILHPIRNLFVKESDRASCRSPKISHECHFQTALHICKAKRMGVGLDMRHLYSKVIPFHGF